MSEDGSAGFMITVLPVTSAAETIPVKNRDREIPGRYDERDAARPVMLVAFFAEDVLGQRRPTEDAHLLRVEEEEIDRLANVAVGFGPRFSDFVNFERGEFEAAPIHDRCDALE